MVIRIVFFNITFRPPLVMQDEITYPGEVKGLERHWHCYNAVVLYFVLRHNMKYIRSRSISVVLFANQNDIV